MKPISDYADKSKKETKENKEKQKPYQRWELNKTGVQN